ncbi:MAG: DUF4440 domain-containing protein [Bacteroidales bacterium]|jgi:ketosteroid isomerase-like protein|nr:DUF4440 domain-containing protein [Bacteroidales bacterium]
MKKLLPLLLLFIWSCKPSVDLEQEKQRMLQTDKDFSSRSVEVGNHQAFLEYAAPDVVLLKPDAYPIVGKPALKKMYDELTDTNYRLTWQPSYAKIAQSGDLGYTFGIYLLEVTDGKQKGAIQRGTYCTIWEKTAQGTWRFVLDTGNPGLGD